MIYEDYLGQRGENDDNWEPFLRSAAELNPTEEMSQLRMKLGGFKLCLKLTSTSKITNL
jgi:hypothetical protein